MNTQPQAQRHRSTADLAVLDVRLADRGHLVKKRGKGAEVSEKCPWNLGLQFQRGLSDGDWDLEERATKKSGRAEAVSVYKGPVPAATMAIPASTEWHMGIFSFKKAHEPADRKTAVSTDATASGLVPPPAAEMTPERVEPPRATPHATVGSGPRDDP